MAFRVLCRMRRARTDDYTALESLTVFWVAMRTLHRAVLSNAVQLFCATSHRGLS